MHVHNNLEYTLNIHTMYIVPQHLWTKYLEPDGKIKQLIN